MNPDPPAAGASAFTTGARPRCIQEESRLPSSPDPAHAGVACAVAGSGLMFWFPWFSPYQVITCNAHM